MRATFWAAIAAAFIGAPLAAAPLSDNYSSYWALGDSLSDNGNLTGVAFTIGTDFAAQSSQTGTNAYYMEKSWTHWDGRFSNGRVWTEHLADAFQREGMATGNFAHGGAEASPDGLWDWIDPTPELQWQRDRLLDQRRNFGDRPLVSLLAGANDIFGAVEKANVVDIAVKAAKSVGEVARSLVSRGVSDFIIGNLPDIGLTPRFSLLDTANKDAATRASLAFNAQIDHEIATLAGGGSNIVKLDLFSIMNQLFDDPTRFGFTDTAHPCYYSDNKSAASVGEARRCSVSDSQTRLFFDQVHPNYRAHQLVGQRVLEELMADPDPMPRLFAAAPQRRMTPTAIDPTPAPVPLPAGGVLLLGGLAMLAATRRRAQS